VLGRIALVDKIGGDLRVSYAYAFSDDMGGGPYRRQQSGNTLASSGSNLISVSAKKPLEEALKEAVVLRQAVIQFTDNATYVPKAGFNWEVKLSDCRLTICAAKDAVRR